MKQPEPLSVEELVELQSIQLKGYLLNAEDEAFTRRLAAAHGVDPAGLNKTWALRGGVIVHLQDEITGQQLSSAATQ